MFSGLYKSLGLVGAILVGFFAIVILGLGITIAVEKLDAGASKPIGNAEKQKTINSGANQLEAQADLKAKKQAVEKDMAQIAADKQVVSQNPGNEFDQNTLTVDQGGCRNAVDDYNKAASDDQEKPYLPTDYPTGYLYSVCQ